LPNFSKNAHYTNSTNQAGANFMAKRHLKLVTPATILRTVTPTRRPNKDLRTREHLTEAEVERLMKATKDNRHSHRDATMILVAYRHGLRASELTEQAAPRAAHPHRRSPRKPIHRNRRKPAGAAGTPLH
jgi:histone H3/H4